MPVARPLKPSSCPKLRLRFTPAEALGTPPAMAGALPSPSPCRRRKKPPPERRLFLLLRCEGRG